ncbi:serine hydrolase domain-containing protein [Aquimarina litoralis]|uniref:serine hydrolase domain-containing protein n=1 Tax=Aquimarina litoralis TaxID=584605 RepID=UPI001C59CDE8|nr:serine hydrolase domain-containing protein [Aquimarina litoralis]MBW1296406.1 serine hydrolase [Aquimarina litoralis]
MINKQFRQLLFVTLFVLQNVMINAQHNKGIDKIDKLMEQEINHLFKSWDIDDTPGATVAIIKNNTIVFKGVYGFANLEFGIRNTPSTLFNIASNSKQFTAYALLNLVEEGKVALDDDIRKYIPELPDFGKTIKVKTLAQHTHGIRGITYLLGMAGWNIEDVISRKNVLTLLSQQKELNFTPETDFSYNNSGYMLLAELIERASGKPFHQYLNEIIFLPLEMKNTVLFENNEKIIPNLASPYFFDGKSYKKGIRNSKDIVGNTGIRTSIEDLSKWVINFERLKIGSKKLFDKLANTVILKNGDTLSYAFGQRVSRYKGRKVISHGGADAGYRSQILRFPDEKLSIIVLTNDGSLNADEKAYTIADIYLDNKQTFGGRKSIDTIQKPSRAVAKETLKRYVGKFELQPGFIMEFNEKEEQLYITATGQGTLPLETINEKQFQIRRISATITFVKNKNGDFDTLIFNHNGQNSRGKRIKYHVDNSKLQEYTGFYYSPELRTTYELILENGNLIAKHQRQEKTTLSPLDHHKFSGDTWFFGTLLFEEKDNKIKGFIATTDRVENLVFNKVYQPFTYQ